MTDTRSFDRNVLKAEVMEVIDDTVPSWYCRWSSDGLGDTSRDKLAERITELFMEKVKS